MNFPEVIEYTHDGEKYRAEYDGEHDNPDDCFYMVHQWEPMGFWFKYCHHTYKGIQEILNQQTKEKQMNTLEKYQADVEAAQKLLERAISSFEEAKKQEEEAKAIKLMVPKDGELYTNTVLGYPSTRHECDMSDYFLCTFASTNKAQATAFADALAVMAEMRMQDGIVNPVGESVSISYNLEVEHLEYDWWESSTGLSLFPCYKDEQSARAAVYLVGEQRVIDCIKTMNFMTPESRGEM